MTRLSLAMFLVSLICSGCGSQREIKLDGADKYQVDEAIKLANAYIIDYCSKKEITLEGFPDNYVIDWWGSALKDSVEINLNYAQRGSDFTKRAITADKYVQTGFGGFPLLISISILIQTHDRAGYKYHVTQAVFAEM